MRKKEFLFFLNENSIKMFWFEKINEIKGKNWFDLKIKESVLILKEKE